MERREFLASSMGMFTTLAVINQVSGCGGENGDGTTERADDVQQQWQRRAGGGSGVGTSGSGGAARAWRRGAGGAGAGAGGSSGGSGSSGGGAGSSGMGGGGAGGTEPMTCADCPYIVPVEATCEETDLLAGDNEFIFDIQTHSFDDGEWREKNTTYASFLEFLATCGDAGRRLNCFDRESLRQIHVRRERHDDQRDHVVAGAAVHAAT